jgi:hypothetical protein
MSAKDELFDVPLALIDRSAPSSLAHTCLQVSIWKNFLLAVNKATASLNVK